MEKYCFECTDLYSIRIVKLHLEMFHFVKKVWWKNIKRNYHEKKANWNLSKYLDYEIVFTAVQPSTKDNLKI